MKYILGIVLSLGICVLLNGANTRNHRHDDPKINAEFDNVYLELKNLRFLPLRTTAQLNATIPQRVGETYFNTDTNELWISTGTAVNQFIHK